jgi:hypothetical protein
MKIRWRCCACDNSYTVKDGQNVCLYCRHEKCDYCDIKYVEYRSNPRAHRHAPRARGRAYFERGHRRLGWRLLRRIRGGETEM